MTGSSIERLAQAFGCVSEASVYGFSTQAAVDAALEILKDAERDDLLVVASVLAGYLAVEMRPRDATWEASGVWSDVNLWLLGGEPVR